MLLLLGPVFFFTALSVVLPRSNLNIHLFLFVSKQCQELMTQRGRERGGGRGRGRGRGFPANLGETEIEWNNGSLC